MSRVLRVGLILHQGERLGAGLSVVRALPGLQQWGWRFEAWLARPGPLRDDLGPLCESIEESASPIHYSFRSWRREGFASQGPSAVQYGRMLSSHLLKTQPHVVHANTLLSLPEAVIARRCGFPVVLQVHELPPTSLKLRVALSLAARVADIAVGVSAPVVEMLTPYFGTGRTMLVYNGVPAPPVAMRSEMSSRPVVFGSVCSICERKGVDVLFDAAVAVLEEFPEARFEHVGPAVRGEEAFHGKIMDKHASLPLSLRSRITFHGELRDPQERVAGWTVFALASKQDPFPLVVLEAMALGVPVVAAAVGGIPEQIDQGNTGLLVQPDDRIALRDALGSLLGNRARASKLGKAASVVVAERFSLQSQSDTLHEAYLRAIRRRLRVESLP